MQNTPFWRDCFEIKLNFYFTFLLITLLYYFTCSELSLLVKSRIVLIIIPRTWDRRRSEASFHSFRSDTVGASEDQYEISYDVRKLEPLSSLIEIQSVKTKFDYQSIRELINTVFHFCTLLTARPFLCFSQVRVSLVHMPHFNPPPLPPPAK